MSQKFYYIDCKEGLLSDHLIVYDSELGVFLTRCSESNKLLAEKLTIQTVCDGVVQLVCADNKSFWYNPVLNKFYSQPTNFVSDTGLFGISNYNRYIDPGFKFDLEFGYMACSE